MITYKKMENLSSLELAAVRDHSEKEYQKISRSLTNCNLGVEVRALSKQGSKKRFQVTLKLMAPSILAVISNSDWNLPKAVRIAFDELGNRVEKVTKKGSLKGRIKKFFTE